MIHHVMVISVIVHRRRTGRRHRRCGAVGADGARDERLGRACEDPEVIVLRVQVRVHEDRQSVREHPEIAVPIDLS